MKITGVEVVAVTPPPPSGAATPARGPSWWETAEVANPMSRYPRVKRHRSLWRPKWEDQWCRVTTEDGSWGLGPLANAPPAATVVAHLATVLVGEEAEEIARIADILSRMTKPYGTQGIASCAISAVELALWDLAGRVQGRPVWSLLGGARKPMECYATGNDAAWYRELGFRAVKLACPYGPADADEGIRGNVELVSRARQILGSGCRLMLDCWMSQDVAYAARLAEALAPFDLYWIEECLIPEDLDGHLELRARLPAARLAAGEHWSTPYPFRWALRHGALDVLQPDIAWCGGMTTCLEIAATAQVKGVPVILHAGGNTPWGQHFSLAAEGVPCMEYLVRTPPGVPLEEAPRPPGVPVPRDGLLLPSDEPGFGHGVRPEWIHPWPVR